MKADPQTRLPCKIKLNPFNKIQSGMQLKMNSIEQKGMSGQVSPQRNRLRISQGKQIMEKQ